MKNVKRKKDFPRATDGAPTGATLVTLLKRYRLSEGLDQSAVAGRVGVTVSAYSAWETGRCVPRGKHVRKLAGVLGVDPMELTRIIVPETQPGDFRHASAK